MANSQAVNFLLLILILSSLRKGQSKLNTPKEDDDYDISHLRILTLGTSITWGAGIPDRSKSYPFLLSENVTNLAIRSCGPNYPAMCAQSLVGNDEIYDIIILEYVMTAEEGLETLAKRLRQRFPDATIIFNTNWNPSFLVGIDAETSIEMSWVTTYKALGYKFPIKPEALAALEKKFSGYKFGFRLDKKLEFLRSIKHAVSGHEVGMSIRETIPFILPRLNYFVDGVHFSNLGHEKVAENLRKYIHKLRPKQSNRLGTWGEGDACHMWYLDGKVNMKYSENMVMNNFGKQESQSKFALEVPAEGGHFHLDNPFDSPRQLLLSYMATGPDSSIYPEAHATVVGTEVQSVTLNPFTADFAFPVHLSKTSRVGIIQPGKSDVYIKPLFPELKEVPFRITALAIVGLHYRDSSAEGNTSVLRIGSTNVN